MLLFFTACDAAPDSSLVVVESLAPTATAVAVAPADTPAPSEVPTAEPTPTAEPEPQTEEEWLYAYIDSMTAEEKIGQLCMFGFSGQDAISGTFKEIMQARHVGNVILYGTNIDRYASDGGFSRCTKLTNSINAANLSEIPFLISTDVEGGMVTRFKWPKWPTHAATLGKKNDAALAQETFARVGQGLSEVGINTDLAPVLDVAKNPLSTFLEQRIISSDASITARIGAACIAGLQEGGTLSVVKHFPGHGATTEDSHAKTPVVQKSLAQMQEYELLPFAACAADADGVMVAHILYPEVDDEVASVSQVWITDILREELGFDGFVMSDDYRMAGLTSKYSVETAAVQFILAGGDLILCGPRHELQTRILDALCEAVSDGRISTERLNESVFRILRAKMRVTDFDPQAALGET